MAKKVSKFGSHSHQAWRSDKTTDWNEIFPKSPQKGTSFHAVERPAEPALMLVPAAAVAASAIQYLWPPTIALGKVTVILAPAACTSVLMTELAAKASVGGSLPQCQIKVPLSQVVIFAPEMRIKTTIQPQLDGAGADLTRVHFPTSGGKMGIDTLDEEFLFQALSAATPNVDDLKLALVELGSARSGADLAEHLSRWLVAFQGRASQLGVALVLVIQHPDDPAAPKQIRLAAKGIAATNVVGAVGFVAREKGDGRWVLNWVKNLVGHEAPAIAFRIAQKTTKSGTPVAGLVWDAEPAAMTEVGTLQDRIPLGGRASTTRRNAVHRAEDFLTQILHSGPVPVEKAVADGTAAGISEASLRRACKSLGVQKQRKGGIGSKGYWVWQLPGPAKGGRA
jgi:putative DNA primase/helicase